MSACSPNLGSCITCSFPQANPRTAPAISNATRAAIKTASKRWERTQENPRLLSMSPPTMAHNATCQTEMNSK